MFDAPDSLREALLASHDRLQSAQRAVARANAGGDAGRSADAAMAATASETIFSEALLEAERAHFSELKAVTK